jgi:hypothetical protein
VQVIASAKALSKRKRSQQEKNDKLAAKLARKRARAGRQHAVDLQTRTVGEDLMHPWNSPNTQDQTETKHNRVPPASWSMNIADVHVDDFVVLEVVYKRPDARGISVALVTFCVLCAYYVCLCFILCILFQHIV